MWDKLLSEFVAAMVRFLDMREGNAVERRFYFKDEYYSVSIKRLDTESSTADE